MTVEELTGIKELLNQKKEAVQRLNAVLEHQKEELKEKYGITSGKQLSERIEQLKAEIAAKRQEYETRCTAFVEKYQEVLGGL